ncbi:hypothetical protein KQX54_016439 [Cotesia glomerata]|uniref:Uncharacterized protein n=1 Tax=Cotesia glomerata TaxID=32391 RepID=A0AAV7I9S6_COTGL|nr:hypothetical protein KQX54_016439 [Cotesia glomerata]
MVCDAAGGYPAELGEDVSLKSSLEELLKCMLRVWCREGQALTKLGAPEPEIILSRKEKISSSVFKDFDSKCSNDNS